VKSMANSLDSLLAAMSPLEDVAREHTQQETLDPRRFCPDTAGPAGTPTGS
jgi:hypothetical protein